MAERAEIGQYIKGGAQVGLGLGIEGYGVKVNGSMLTIPADEITKIVGSAGSGSLPDFLTTVAHLPTDVLSALAHLGPEGALAGLAIGLGTFVVGKGANAIHDARRAAGR